MVDTFDKIFGHICAFNDTNQPLFGITNKDHQVICYSTEEALCYREAYLNFTEDMYIRLLGIDSKESADDFFADYPYFRFCFEGTYNKTYGLITKENYLQHVVDSIRNFLAFIELRKKAQVYLSEPSDFEKWIDIVRFIATCKSVGCFVDEESIDDCKQFIELGVDDNKKSADIVVRTLLRELSKCFEKEMSCVNTYSSPTKNSIIYYCPTLLSAMYTQLFVSEFNRDEYCQCANKKCTKYFKRDKTHPQTLCPEHMSSRQRRRLKQKIKQKQVESCPYDEE